MKFRNFANKLLLVILLVVVCCGQTAAHLSVLPLSTAQAETPATKTYFFNQYNYNAETNQSLYDALGITVYNDYLAAVQAARGLNNVVVAVVDSGLNPTHPVFANRILTEYARDFSKGVQSSMESNDWDKDHNGHGTHVAGIIADTTLDNVKILPIKIFHGVDNEMDDNAYENAIRYLVALKSGSSSIKLLNKENLEEFVCNPDGVRLNIIAVNLSLGSKSYNVYNSTDMQEFNRLKDGYIEGNVRVFGHQELMDFMLRYDMMPIVAAGNLGSLDSKNNTYYCLPAACGGVLAVAAYDNQVNKYQSASFSYHNDRISISAPGVQIWSACSQDIVDELSESTRLPGYEGVKVDRYGTYEVHNYSGLKKRVRQDENGVFYLRDQGTSMANPFVTACYAMLMSDTSKTTAEDFGLTWDEKGSDEHFMNLQHKALLAAAATYGDQGAAGFDEYFGYGTVNVGVFAQSSMAESLTGIKYEILPSTTYESSWLGGFFLETDWYQVCLILLFGVFLIWGFSYFRSYFGRRKINDNEPEQPTFE